MTSEFGSRGEVSGQKDGGVPLPGGKSLGSGAEPRNPGIAGNAKEGRFSSGAGERTPTSERSSGETVAWAGGQATSEKGRSGPIEKMTAGTFIVGSSGGKEGIIIDGQHASELLGDTRGSTAPSEGERDHKDVDVTGYLPRDTGQRFSDAQMRGVESGLRLMDESREPRNDGLKGGTLLDQSDEQRGEQVETVFSKPLSGSEEGRKLQDVEVRDSQEPTDKGKGDTGAKSEVSERTESPNSASGTGEDVPPATPPSTEGSAAEEREDNGGKKEAEGVSGVADKPTESPSEPTTVFETTTDDNSVGETKGTEGEGRDESKEDVSSITEAKQDRSDQTENHPSDSVSEGEEAKSQSDQPQEDSEESRKQKWIKAVTEKATESLGEEGAAEVVEATQRWGEEYQEERQQTLWRAPDFVNAARAVGVDQEKTQDLLLHTINAHGDNPSRVDDSVKYLTRGLEYSSAHRQTVSEEDVGALKGMITTAADKGAVHASLRAYESARQAGLSLGESVDLVNTVTEHANTSRPSIPVDQVARSLDTLHIAGVDSEQVKRIFTETAQLPHPERSSAHYAFERAIEAGLRADVKPKAVVDAVAAQIDSGTSINDALLGKWTEYDQVAPPRTEVEFPSDERKGELERLVDTAFENPLEDTTTTESGHSDSTLAVAKESFAQKGHLPDSEIMNFSGPEAGAHRVTVYDPEEYKIVLERARQKLLEQDGEDGEVLSRYMKIASEHEGIHAAVAKRANAVREDTELEVTEEKKRLRSFRKIYFSVFFFLSLLLCLYGSIPNSSLSVYDKS